MIRIDWRAMWVGLTWKDVGRDVFLGSEYRHYLVKICLIPFVQVRFTFRIQEP